MGSHEPLRERARLPHPDAREGLVLAWDLRSRHGVPEMVFVDEMSRGHLNYARAERLSIDPKQSSPNGLGEVLCSRESSGRVQRVLRLTGGALALVETARDSAQIEVAADSHETLERGCAELAACLGAVEQAEDEVAVTFWSLGANGPRSALRRITAPAWSEIDDGYGAAAADVVHELEGSEAPNSGRLILWHGAPGTGKTSAVRALARGWRDWCATHFITDPEAFLGTGTSYLLDVLVSEPRSPRGDAPGWKLVVLEDSGELLTADAHERTGQALSRLLNVTDGLIGQGMKVLVLVTTNEPLRRLHPAIQRPGRCWKEVEFQALPREQANAWLASRGTNARVSGSASLAELYALSRGEDPAEEVSFGFGARHE